jgi:uncharacterized membrane protein
MLVIGALAISAIVVGRPMIRPRCTALDVSGITLSIPAAEIPVGAAKFYCVRDRAGALIRFVLARSSDGQVRSVFDACSQCYRFRKGYTVAGDYLICRLCGNRYRLHDMQKGMASCVPVGINANLNGGKIEVRVAELEKGRLLF